MAAIIEFEGRGESLITSIEQITQATIKLRDETNKSGDAIKKQALEGTAAEAKLAVTIETTAQGMQALRKEAEKGGSGKIAKDYEAAAKASKEFATGADRSTDAIRRSREEAAKLILEANDLTDAQKESTAAAGGITKEYLAAAAAAKKLSDVPAPKIAPAVNAAGQQTVTPAGTPIPAIPPIDPQLTKAKSLRTELREAKAELDKIIEASNGQLTPELAAAATRAGELQDRFGDLNATVEAFNPDTKFKAVLGVIGNLTGGIQAGTAALGLFGAESDDVNKALLKVQQASAFFQGLQSFIGGLADNWKNLRLVISASAIATQADTAAKTANAAGTAAVATANTAAASATGVFTTALNAMKAALLSNPITAVAVAVLALGAAFVAATTDTKDYTAAVDDLITSLDEVSQSRFNTIDQNLRLQGIENEREALEAGETEAAKRRQREKDYLAERAALVGKQLERELNIRSLIVELENLRGKDSDSANEARQKALDKLQEYSEAFKQGNADIKFLELEQTNTTISENNKRTTSNADAARARVRSLEAAAAEIRKIEEDLKNRVAALELEGADPRRLVELEREAALESINILRRTLQEKIAIQKIEEQTSTEVFKNLSDAQKKARVDALIDQGGAELSVEQIEKFTALEIAAIEAYWEERKAIDTTERQALLDLQEAGFEKERAAFDLELEGRVQKLRENGATVLQIEQFIAQQRDQFRLGQVGKAIDVEEQIALANIDALQRGSESEAAFRFRVEMEKLAVQEDFARQRLALVQDDGTQESALLKAQLEAKLAAIAEARGELEKNKPKQDIFGLLGIEMDPDERARFTASLKSIGSTILQFINDNLAAQREALDSEIALNDERISEQQRLRSELQSQLDAALKDEAQGYASNSDSIRQQIELTKSAEAEALNAKKRAQAEKKKLAQQQLILDSATQISALITANANLFVAGSLQGPAGIIAAVAAGLSLLATFASIRAKAKAAAAADPASFHKGTKYVQLGANPKGRDTVPAYLDEGEAVVSAKNRKKFEPLVDAIVEGDQNKVYEAAIKELLGNRIQLDRERVTKFVTLKERLVTHKEIVKSEGDDGLRKDVKRLTGIVEAFMVQEENRERPTSKEVSTPTRKVTKR